MLRARRLVLMLGFLVTGYLLIQFYFFRTCPIGVMCSASNAEVAMKIIMVVAATGISYWLLKPDQAKQDQAQPVQPASPKPEDKPQA